MNGREDRSTIWTIRITSAVLIAAVLVMVVGAVVTNGGAR